MMSEIHNHKHTKSELEYNNITKINMKNINQSHFKNIEYESP